MKQIGILRRGLLLLLCMLCLTSACIVPAYAAGPVPVKCTTPVITYKYFGNFEVAVIIYYDSATTEKITVNVNGRKDTKTVPGNGLPLILGYYLSKDTSILVSAVAQGTGCSDSAPAYLAINGYAVPNSKLRVNTGSPGVNKFNDVPIDAWYRSDVDRLVKAGAIKGMSSTVFAPDNHMTVAEYLKVLLASMYRDDMINAYYKGSKWYDPYFEFSALSINEDGFVGVEDAEREISRYEMAVLLSRAYKMLVQPNVYQHALDSADSGAIGDFDKIPEKYREAVLVCYFAKMLKGMDGEGSFFGDKTLTRCEASATVVRLFNAI